MVRYSGMVKSSLDTLTEEERSKRMSLVRGKDTKPEMIVRRLTFAMGYRYRLHAKDLPGKPDLVFRKRKKVIFVHGCFWHHHHPQCPQARLPKSPEMREFWKKKLAGNAERDKTNQEKLRELGWDILVIWECETKIPEKVARVIRVYLDVEERC